MRFAAALIALALLLPAPAALAGTWDSVRAVADRPALAPRVESLTMTDPEPEPQPVQLRVDAVRTADPARALGKLWSEAWLARFIWIVIGQDRPATVEPPAGQGGQ